MRVSPLLEVIGDWKEFLSTETDEQKVKKIRHHENSGRPLGDETFDARLEKLLNCSLKLIKPGKREEINMVSPEYGNEKKEGESFSLPNN